jgi:hypothetical protein
MRWILCLLAGVWSVFACGSSTEERTEPPKAPPPPLCERFAEYFVGRDDLNKAISPCDIYIYADAHSPAADERYFRVVIRRGNPVEFDEYGSPFAPKDQLQPYHYKWIVLGEDGQPIRSWLAYFLRNRDGTYHTVIRMPGEEWAASRLEIYFEDVNADGSREDVTYVLAVGDILGLD